MNTPQYNKPLISPRDVPDDLNAAPQLPTQAQVYAQHTPYNTPVVVPHQNYVPIPNQPIPSYQYAQPIQQIQIIQPVQPVRPVCFNFKFFGNVRTYARLKRSSRS